MPLMVDENRVPHYFRTTDNGLAVKNFENYNASESYIRIGLVNNMPDSALHDTESQFFDLLAEAADDVPIHVSLYAIPEIPRGDRGNRHVASYYRSIDDLWDSRVDAIIVTGTEPRYANLRHEPYWNRLTALFDWAEDNTKSAVLSCLAAHAGVLHSDGIKRHPLTEKKCGMFEQKLAEPHALTQRIAGSVRFPHSRWNEVREEELASHGYSILTKSDEAGVDLFVKKKRRSLFVHFQGHPEYGARTLLKEYRRDVGRFLRKERHTYPSLPRNYFDAGSSKLLANFQDGASRNAREMSLASFPETTVAASLERAWQSAAIRIYRNWLEYLVAKKTELMTVHAKREGRAHAAAQNAPGPVSSKISSANTTRNAGTSRP
ncbi:MAG: homoserine O-succinyltransferase MetA [Candidatus Acidiferrales bacterium]